MPAPRNESLTQCEKKKAADRQVALLAKTHKRAHLTGSTQRHKKNPGKIYGVGEKGYSRKKRLQNKKGD